MEAVRIEMQQLHDREVGEPEDASLLTWEEKQKALAYLMFLKENVMGRLKAGDVPTDENNACKCPRTSSPTVSMEAVFISCGIDAKEERDVATADIPGAFMHADMEGIVRIRLEGTMVALLLQIDHAKYAPYVIYEGNKMILYLRLKKALYGTLQASLLFWRDLSAKLKVWGFVTNPYDTCVVNKEINGSQCTILWHVDDLKISHVDPDVVTDIINKLNGAYGGLAPLTVTRGKVHEYLGMTVDFTETGIASISMVPYIDEMLGELPEDMHGESPTPAANHLFETNDNQEKLDGATSTMFHHNVAKLLFLSK